MVPAVLERGSEDLGSRVVVWGQGRVGQVEQVVELSAGEGGGGLRPAGGGGAYQLYSYCRELL